MKRVKQFLISIKIDISKGENLDAYIAILLGLLFTFADILGITDFDVLGPAILLTLTFVAFGSLANRKTVEHLESTLQRITLNEDILRKFEFPNSTTGEHFQKAKMISVLGISLYRFVPMFHHFIEESTAKRV